MYTRLQQNKVIKLIHVYIYPQCQSISEFILSILMFISDLWYIDDQHFYTVASLLYSSRFKNSRITLNSRITFIQ